MKIGFIGLGIMGSRMAGNLLKGYPDLLVYNRDQSKGETLQQQGATIARSTKEIATTCDIVITMLSTPQVVKKLALGENGFLPHMKPDSLWIDSTTVNPSFTKEMASAAAEQKVRFIDAPVAGSLIPAETAQLLFLTGGDIKDIDQAQPLFDLMGRKTIHVGSHGMGSSLKMVINLLLGQSLAVFSEAVAFGKTIGLSEELLLHTLIDGPVVAPFVGLKKDNFTSGTYSPEFPLEWMHKDVKLAIKTAEEYDLRLASGAAAEGYFTTALNEGRSRDDCSAIYATLTKKETN